MTIRRFTASERAQLELLDAVERVTPGGMIRYSPDFRERALREYGAGKSPMRIFADAGFPVETLGNKRIERAFAHWRKGL
ncbi:hypothetical protein [Bifidobacterium avesanii]|uniref:Uncharacterized protein n=1 Tax=Bifidobacterium avesanii TaxID=1798157 RepID=A0A7K3TIT1_9BIFI|nr:hypothetical protein [Bifidobacterium avesanii]KAB8292662.1 hypothetical protein DSM100685_0951 [Bifidobacterium avesanii]NEG78510.1 hypothetical protein [Bifidobacterium avesanii]